MIHSRLIMVVDGVPVQGKWQVEDPIEDLKLGPTGRIDSLVVKDESVKILYMDLTKLSFIGVETVELANEKK